MAYIDHDICRLCLVKERVSIPIFGEEEVSLQIFHKISSCLPVNVARNDKLPQKICYMCFVKVENVYHFWNSTAKAEKQLIQWLDETDVSEDNGVNSTIKIEQVIVKEEEEEHNADVTHCWSNVEVQLEENIQKCVIPDSQKNESSSFNIEVEDSESDSCRELELRTSKMMSSDEIRPSVLQEQQQLSSNVVNPIEVCTGKNAVVPTCSWQVTPPSSSFHTLVNTMMFKYQMLELEQQHIAMTKSICLQTPASLQLDSRPTTVLEGRNCNEQDIVSSLKNDTLIPEEPLTDKIVEVLNSGKTTNFSEEIQASKMLNEERCIEYKLEINTKLKNKVSMKQVNGNKSDQINISATTTTTQSETICELCGKCVSRPYLKQHIATHSVQRPFQCDVCKKTFKLKRLLRVHKKIHFKNLDFICKSCGYMTYSKNILLQHEKRHSNESIYKCEICTRTFSSKYYLQDHTMMHMGAKPYECEKCGKQYHTKGGLYMHMKTHDSNYVEKVGQGEYCNVCGKTVKRLRRHRKTHQFMAEREEYTCDICGKCVTSRSSLKIHLRIHSGEKPYSCDICSKAFADSRYLMMHVRSHTGERPFTCDQCGKSFTQQGSLRIHKMSHSGEKPYKCNMCSKAFVTNTLLKVHTKSHNDER